MERHLWSWRHYAKQSQDEPSKATPSQAQPKLHLLSQAKPSAPCPATLPGRILPVNIVASTSPNWKAEKDKRRKKMLSYECDPKPASAGKSQPFAHHHCTIYKSWFCKINQSKNCCQSSSQGQKGYNIDFTAKIQLCHELYNCSKHSKFRFFSFVPLLLTTIDCSKPLPLWKRWTLNACLIGTRFAKSALVD